jgi:hypothetical protein
MHVFSDLTRTLQGVKEVLLDVNALPVVVLRCSHGQVPGYAH